MRLKAEAVLLPQTWEAQAGQQLSEPSERCRVCLECANTEASKSGFQFWFVFVFFSFDASVVNKYAILDYFRTAEVVKAPEPEHNHKWLGWEEQWMYRIRWHLMNMDLPQKKQQQSLSDGKWLDSRMAALLLCFSCICCGICSVTATWSTIATEKN